MKAKQFTTANNQTTLDLYIVEANANKYNLMGTIARDAVAAGLDLNSAHLCDLFIDAQTLHERANDEGVVFLSVNFTGCTWQIGNPDAFKLDIINLHDADRVVAIYKVERLDTTDPLGSYRVTRVTAATVDQFFGRR